MIKLGFIGLGTMGLPMCMNLMKKHKAAMYVYDLSQDAVLKAQEAGAIPCESGIEVVEKSDIIFTMLPENHHVTAVYDSLLEKIRKNQLFVDMSTISPDVSATVAKKIVEKGGKMIDAPVVKSKPAAIAGTLGIYVGGEEEDYKIALPYLNSMGENVIYLGQNGAGLVMKLCHNLLVAQIQNGVNETLSIAEKTYGIDVETFAQAISYGGGQNFYLTSKKDTLAQKDYTMAFALDYMKKDLGLAKKLVEEEGLEYEGLNLVLSRYEAASAKGFGKEDFSATYKLFE